MLTSGIVCNNIGLKWPPSTFSSSTHHCLEESTHSSKPVTIALNVKYWYTIDWFWGFFLFYLILGQQLFTIKATSPFLWVIDLVTLRMLWKKILAFHAMRFLIWHINMIQYKLWLQHLLQCLKIRRHLTNFDILFILDVNFSDFASWCIWWLFSTTAS